MSPRRFLVSLLGGFSVLALLLASLGIYGVVSYGVSRRIRGVRRAHGARRDRGRRPPADRRRHAALALVGIAIGAAVSLALSRVINTLLFATSATDPWTFAGMVVVLGVVALIAGYLPARRASRIDPMTALR